MSWAEVKKINSDMTKPLDKLILEHKGLAASDQVMCVLFNSTDGLNGEKTIGTFTPTVSGSVRILCCGNGVHNVSKAHVRVKDSNNNIVADVVISFDNANDYTVYSVDMNISKGETYTVVSSGRWNTESIKIGAIVTDTSLLSYTIND